MEDYKIHTITKDAKELQEKYYCNVETSNIDITKEADFSNSDEIDANYLTTYPNESSTELLQVSDLGFILIGDEKIDIRMIHDIATIPQLNAIAFLIRKLTQRINPMERYQKYSVQKLFVNEVEEKIINRKEEVEKLLQTIEIEGLESSYSTFFTDCMRWMDLPRKYEILAVLSRMQFQNKENGINKKQ